MFKKNVKRQRVHKVKRHKMKADMAENTRDTFGW